MPLKKETTQPAKPEFSEEKMLRMMKEKEERDRDLYNRLADVEPEEETLEQKLERHKKELEFNRVR